MSHQFIPERGFTLIELLLAMTVFSFLLIIVVSGIVNVLHIRDQALASNKAQDNARIAMNELVRAVRDSSGIIGVPGPGPSGTLCLSRQGGLVMEYYVQAGILMRSDNCGTPRVNPTQITNDVVSVVDFEAVVESTGPTIVKPEVSLTVQVASSNGTSTGGTCNNNNEDRTFCGTATITSGAVPR